ncbi:MAG: hypothetical protein WBV81_00225 [Ignavibacteriaceae bacterium]
MLEFEWMAGIQKITLNRAIHLYFKGSLVFAHPFRCIRQNGLISKDKEFLPHWMEAF